MEGKLMKQLAQNIDEGRRTALVTLVEVSGSSPGKEGDMMTVLECGKIMGTVGGGNLEYQLIGEARKAMGEGKNREVEYDLGPEGNLKMECGGRVRAYIKVFKEREKLVIVGGGHLGLELYTLGKFLNMYVAVFDDREDYANSERFPLADEVIPGNIGENLREYSLNKSSYVVVVTKGHAGDREAIEAVAGREIAYLGMIGSSRKIKKSYDILMDKGVQRDELSRVYAPVGLDISTGEPKEIALGIMAEILKVKNGRSGKHMREIKGIEV